MKKIVLSLSLVFALSFTIKAQITIDSTNVVYTCLDCDSIGVVPLPSSYGSLYIAVSGGVSPYNFSLTGIHSANSSPLTTSSISGVTNFYNTLCQDTFNLIISDANGSNTTYNFTTVPPASPTLSIDSVTVQADSTNNPDSGVIDLHVTTNADSVFYLIKDVGNILNLGTNGGWQDSTIFDSLPGGYYYKVFVDIYPKIVPNCGNGIDTGSSVFQIYVPLACENDGFADFGLYPACVGEQVAFQDFSYPGSGTNNIVTNWDWDFGDGNFDYGPVGFNTYAQPGIYNVNLQVTTSHGCMFVVAYPVTIYPIPTPSFTYTNNGSGQYTFTDQSTLTSGTISNWYWDFGDGNTSNIQNPIHQYSSTGNFSVCLEVYSNNNCMDSVCNNVDFTVGLDQIKTKKDEIVIFPNPTKEYISILNIDYTDVEIYDVTGSLVKSFYSTNKKINVATLPKGFYFIKIVNEEGVFDCKFIKE